MMRLSLDRLEGVRKELAVLVTEDGRSFVVPRGLLPPGTKVGEILTLRLERDLEATAGVARRARALREELDKTDPGGDIKL